MQTFPACIAHSFSAIFKIFIAFINIRLHGRKNRKFKRRHFYDFTTFKILKYGFQRLSGCYIRNTIY